MRRLTFLSIVLIAVSSLYLGTNFVPTQLSNAVAANVEQSDRKSPKPSSTTEPKVEPKEEPKSKIERSEEAETTDTEDSSADLSDPKVDQEYRAMVERFFTMLEAEGAEVALEELFESNLYMEEVSGQVTTLINQYTSAERMMGAYIGHELLIETNMADRVAHQRYLVLYERQPLRFDFVYYKADDEWTFQSFNFAADVLEKVKEISDIGLLGSEKVRLYPVVPSEGESLTFTSR